MMNREIPKKNYIILGVVIVLTFLLMYYFYMWYDAYMDTKLGNPILDKYMEVINYNELDNYLVENNNVIIYVSVLEDSQIRDFEKKLKGLYKKHEIERDILYMDVTQDKKIVDKIVTEYSNSSFNYDIPVFLVIENGSIKGFYNVKENGYDVQNVKLFIDSIKFLEEDEING